MYAKLHCSVAFGRVTRLFLHVEFRCDSEYRLMVHLT